jgi:hypothetical protein
LTSVRRGARTPSRMAHRRIRCAPLGSSDTILLLSRIGKRRNAGFAPSNQYSGQVALKEFAIAVVPETAESGSTVDEQGIRSSGAALHGEFGQFIACTPIQGHWITKLPRASLSGTRANGEAREFVAARRAFHAHHPTAHSGTDICLWCKVTAGGQLPRHPCHKLTDLRLLSCLGY